MNHAIPLLGTGLSRSNEAPIQLKRDDEETRDGTTEYYGFAVYLGSYLFFGSFFHSWISFSFFRGG